MTIDQRITLTLGLASILAQTLAALIPLILWWLDRRSMPKASDPDA